MKGSASDPTHLSMYDTDVDFKNAKVVLVPIPFDGTVSYGAGTHLGPGAIQKASAQVELFDLEMGRPDKVGIVMLPADERICVLNAKARAAALEVQKGLEAGAEVGPQTALVNQSCEMLNGIVYACVKDLLKAKYTVGSVGGDHGSVFGSIQAMAESFPGMGILHIDAHADLRRFYQGFEFSHASIMEAVTRHLTDISALVQVGIRDFCEEELGRIRQSPNIHTFFDVDLSRRQLEGETWADLVAEIIAPLPETVYVSLDIDGLDPALCPSTGTPVPGGLSFYQLNYLLRALVLSGRRIVGFDVVEVAPSSQGGEWDANVGARVLYKLIGWTLKSQGHL